MLHHGYTHKVLIQFNQNNTIMSKKKNSLFIMVTDRELDGLQYMGHYVESKLL